MADTTIGIECLSRYHANIRLLNIKIIKKYLSTVLMMMKALYIESIYLYKLPIESSSCSENSLTPAEVPH